MLNKIVALLKSLNSNSKPSQIANSFCLGLLLGLMPKTNLLWYMLMIFFAFVRINKAGYWLWMLIGSLLGSLFDPMFDTIGYAVLTWSPLENFFDWWINVPFLAFTKLNNTIVCGSLVFSLICYIPLFALFIGFLKIWRKTIAPAFINSKMLKTLYQIPALANLISKIGQ